MSDHSSLVATFKEKLRPRYGKSNAANSRYIKENVYFNGIALKESLLYDTEYPKTQAPKRILYGHDNILQNNSNKCFELQKGCFIYQNPASFNSDDNDFVHKFNNMSTTNELEVDNSNFNRTLDTEMYKLVGNNTIIIILTSNVRLVSIDNGCYYIPNKLDIILFPHRSS